MATYTINYLTGEMETVEAEGVEYDAEARDYTFFTDGNAIALAPVANVRSVHRKDDDAAPEYPREDGAFIILGPETFSDRALSTISHKGVNYVRQPGPNLFGGKVTD